MSTAGVDRVNATQKSIEQRPSTGTWLTVWFYRRTYFDDRSICHQSAHYINKVALVTLFANLKRAYCSPMTLTLKCIDVYWLQWPLCRAMDL